MSEQSNAAAERSAHVVRHERRTMDIPVFEVAPGVWKLRIVAELEAERDALIADNARLLDSVTRETEARAAAEAERDALRARLKALSANINKVYAAAIRERGEDGR